MTVRVPTLARSENGLALLTRLQSDIARIQEQISTGRAILSPADDPAGASRTLVYRQTIAALAQFTRNSDAAVGRLSVAEDSLRQATDRLEHVRELVLQAANATQSNESRAAIALSVRGALGDLVAIANATDGQGRHLFGGFRDSANPFVATASGIEYRGDNGERQIQIGERRFIHDSENGEQLFVRIPEANGVFSAAPNGANTGSLIAGELSVIDASLYDGGTYSIVFTSPSDYEVRDAGSTVVATGSIASGDSVSFNGVAVQLTGEPATGDSIDVRPAGQQDIFATLEGIAAALERGSSDAPTLAALTSELNRGLENVDQALSSVLHGRERIGTRLAAIESQVDANEGLELIARTSLADVEELDYTQAVTALSQQLTALEAAQQSFVRIQGLSLFNVL